MQHELTDELWVTTLCPLRQWVGYLVIERGVRPPVREEGVLGQFNPSLYETGLYQFRLVVFDITNTLIAACTVNIYLEEPLPTATRPA